jgi:hypothetical protein
MPRRLVCLSSTDAAMGAQVGRLVADALGFRYVDEQIIARAAELAQVDPAVVAAAEKRQPLLDRILDKLAAAQDMAGPVALGALLPVGVAVWWLLVARRRAWFVRPARWTPAVATAVAFMAVLVLSKVLDRLPDTLVGWHLVTLLSEPARLFLQAWEELLELALPVLALCGIVQAGSSLSVAHQSI